MYLFYSIIKEPRCNYAKNLCSAQTPLKGRDYLSREMQSSALLTQNDALIPLEVFCLVTCFVYIKESRQQMKELYHQLLQMHKFISSNNNNWFVQSISSCRSELNALWMKEYKLTVNHTTKERKRQQTGNTFTAIKDIYGWGENRTACLSDLSSCI